VNDLPEIREGMRGADYVPALQGLLARIEALEARIEALEARQDWLRNVVDPEAD
jgi:hypothetical protein